MLEERIFKAGSLSINFAEGPRRGQPLVLLHGGSARWQSWWPILDPLEAHTHLYAPDFRGHGGSSWTPGHYRLVDYAEDIGAFLREIVRESATLFGHSLGGEVALIVAAKTPELVRAVIVEDAPLSIDGARRAIEPPRSNLELMRTLAGSALPIAEIQERAGDLLVDAERSIRMKDVASETDLEMYAGSLRRHDPTMLDAVLEFEEMHAGYDDSLLARVRCPVLILQADPGHGGISDSDLQRAIEVLHDGRSVTFPGRGHSIHMEDRQGVIDAVTTFLNRSTA